MPEPGGEPPSTPLLKSFTNTLLSDAFFKIGGEGFKVEPTYKSVISIYKSEQEHHAQCLWVIKEKVPAAPVPCLSFDLSPCGQLPCSATGSTLHRAP